MRKTTFVVLAAILAVGVYAWAATQVKVEAKISSKCSPVPGAISVPAGKTATGFKLLYLANGQNCHTGGTADSKGWSIKNARGKNVYSWSAYKRNKPIELGGPLSKLSIGPGVYKVYVDGGRGALARVQYTLK